MKSFPRRRVWFSHPTTMTLFHTITLSIITGSVTLSHIPVFVVPEKSTKVMSFRGFACGRVTTWLARFYISLLHPDRWAPVSTKHITTWSKTLKLIIQNKGVQSSTPSHSSMSHSLSSLSCRIPILRYLHEDNWYERHWYHIHSLHSCFRHYNKFFVVSLNYLQVGFYQWTSLHSELQPPVSVGKYFFASRFPSFQ